MGVAPGIKRAVPMWLLALPGNSLEIQNLGLHPDFLEEDQHLPRIAETSARLSVRKDEGQGRHEEATMAPSLPLLP